MSSFQKTDQSVFEKIKKGSFTFEGVSWRQVSEVCRDFIKTCLTFNPAVRPSARELLQHPWLQGVSWEDSGCISACLQNMLDLKLSNKFQEAVLHLLVSRYLPREDFLDLANAFITLDSSNLGKICLSDFKKGFEMYYRD